MDDQRSAVQAGGHVLLLCGLGVAGEWDAGKQRADERTRTADLTSLRVISQALQGFAQECKSCISKGVSFLCLAACGTVLRSRWCQSGVKIILVFASHRRPVLVYVSPHRASHVEGNVLSSSCCSFFDEPIASKKLCSGTQ
jgi:hypothetical protein